MARRKSYALPLVLSLSVHAALIALLLLAGDRQTERLQQRQQAAIVHVEQQRQAEATLALAEEQALAEELLADELRQQLEDVLIGEVEGEDERQLLDDVETLLAHHFDPAVPSSSSDSATASELADRKTEIWRQTLATLRARTVRDQMQAALLAEVKHFAEVEAAPALRDHLEANVADRTADVAARALQAQMLAFHARRGGRGVQLDDVDLAMGRAALADTASISAALRGALTAAVQERAIPALAEQVANRTAEQLTRAGWPAAALRTEIATEIAAALQRQLHDHAQVDVDVALRSAQARLGLLPEEPLAAAAAQVATAAGELRELGAAMEHASTADTPVSAAMADQIRAAESRASDALRAARRATAEKLGPIATASKTLIGSRAAPDAAAAAAGGAASTTRAQSTNAAMQLDKSAAQLDQVAQALTKQHAAAVAQRTKFNALGRETVQAAGVATATLDESIQQTQAGIAAAAAAEVRASAVRTSKLPSAQPLTAATASRLARLANLQAKLDTLAENATVGRDPAGRTLTQPAVAQSSPPAVGDSEGARFGRGYNQYARLNRDAYQRFAYVTRRRQGTALANAYGEVEVLDGRVSLADFARGARPALIYAATDAPQALHPSPLATVAERALSAPRFETLAYGVAAFQDQPLTIDGDLGDWGELKHPLVMQWRSSGERLDDGIPLFLRWSPIGLFVAYHVPQRAADEIESPVGKPYEGDVLEMWLDVDNLRKASMADSPYAQQFVLMPFGFEGKRRVTFAEVGRGFRGISQHAYRFDAGQSLDECLGMARAKFERGGYTVEGFLGLAALAKQRLRAGQYVAMNFSINRGYDYQQSLGWSMAKDAADSFNRPDTWGDVLLLGTDGNARFVDARDPAQPLGAVVPGDPIGVEIADPDMNSSPTERDRLLAQVQVAGEAAHLYVILQETADNSGLFRGSFATQPNFLPPQANTLNVRGGARLRLQFRDLRTAFGERHRPIDAEMQLGLPLLRFASQ